MPRIPYRVSRSINFFRKSAYLWVVFKCGECHNTALSIEDCDGQVGGLNKLENLGVRVDSIVDVVLAHLDQIYNLIAVVWVGASEDDALEIEVALILMLLFIDFHVVSFHVFFGFNRNTITTTFFSFI